MSRKKKRDPGPPKVWMEDMEITEHRELGTCVSGHCPVCSHPVTLYEHMRSDRSCLCPGRYWSMAPVTVVGELEEGYEDDPAAPREEKP